MRYPTIVASWLKGGFLEPNVGYAVRPHEKVAILVAAVNFVCHCLADWVWYLVLLTSVNMGKVKDLLIEVENIFRQQEEEGLKFGEVDDDTQRQMLGRYIEEKGLKNSSEFDLDDWLKWSERKVVCDIRTPEQKNKEMNMIISLQEIIDMTDEEAEKLGVKHIKNMYYKHKFDEIKKEEFINGETYDDMINNYMKEKGLTLQSEINSKDFGEWLDRKSHEYQTRIRSKT